MKKGKILIVDDNTGVLKALELLLRPYFTEVVTLTSPISLPTLLREPQCKFDVLLLDMNFTAGINSGNEGLYWLHEVHRLIPTLPVVLFTAYADINLAVRGIKEGATDFVVKPWDNNQLVQTLQKAAEGCEKGNSQAKPRPSDNSPLVWGGSPSMQQLCLIVGKVAVTDANILITGENGTGKEVLAREIHRLSHRCNREAICVDMGSISENLFESELFGHVKGAFTDAQADRAGKFEAADGSTLFLDEIGNLPLHLQAKLLTALQSRTIVRVGSNRPIPIDIRLITATNRPLQQMVAEGAFREDLLYRINTIHLRIPSLRERKEDILPLARHFLQRYQARYGKEGPLFFSPDAESVLLHYPWPGNIRELEHAVEKAVIMTSSPQLTASLFELTASLFEQADSGPASIGGTLEEMEIKMIRNAIDRCAGNLSAVAAQLGITRQTLYNKMKKYSI